MAHRRLQMLWPAHALPSSAAATAATAKRHSPRPEISGDETRDTDQESVSESGINSRDLGEIRDPRKSQQLCKHRESS